MNRWREWCKSGLFGLLLAALIGFLSAGAASAHTRLTSTSTVVFESVATHTPEPQMTGPMPGMDDMPGMATQPAQTNSGPTTAIAMAGLLLLTAMVAGAIVIERRRRPSPGAGPSGTSTD